MASVSYQYSRPSETYTIDQFIACQSDTEVSYYNLSFVDRVYYDYMNESIHYSTYNILSDYLDEIREECVTVELSDEELNDYIYRPKLLAYKVYNNAELGFIILIINDMYSVKQFTRAKLLLPTRAKMVEICRELFNTNRTAILAYNNVSLSNKNK